MSGRIVSLLLPLLLACVRPPGALSPDPEPIVTVINDESPAQALTLAVALDGESRELGVVAAGRRATFVLPREGDGGCYRLVATERMRWPVRRSEPFRLPGRTVGVRWTLRPNRLEFFAAASRGAGSTEPTGRVGVPHTPCDSSDR